MNGKTIELTQKAEDLLGILELDIERIERTIQNLNDLRGLVVKRDEQGLTRLLETIQTEVQVYSNNEQHRNQLRKEMAQIIGFKPEAMTLSVLREHIPESWLAGAVADTQEKLKNLVERLRREYVSTVALLSDCARINSVLLKAIFGRGRKDCVCYDSAGELTRPSDAAFMSARI